MGLFEHLITNERLEQIDYYTKGKIQSLSNSEILECIKNSALREGFFEKSSCSSSTIVRELEAEALRRGLEC